MNYERDFNLDNFTYQQRKTFELNELLSSGDPQYVDYALKIKNSLSRAYDQSDNQNEEYSIFTDIERRSIEIDEANNKEHKVFLNKLKQFTPEENKNRDDYQLWSLDKETPKFTENLAEHSQARNIYRIQEVIAENSKFHIRDKNAALEENKSEADNTLGVVNQYLRFELLEDLISHK